MNIGLPLILAVSDCSDPTDLNEPASVDNVHSVWLSESLVVQIITSDEIGLETGGSVWHAGFALASHLVANPHLVHGKDVVEIGSGCGLVGITAAVLGARSVTLTDIPAQQLHIERNIEINRPHWEGRCARVESGILQFGDTRVSKLSSLSGYQENSEIGCNFQVVLGADIGYDLSLHEPIARTLSFLLNSKRKPHSVACSNDIIRGTEDHNRKISLHSEDKIAILVEEIRWHDIHRWYIETLLTHEFEPIKNEITEKEKIEMSYFLDESLLEELDHEKNRVIEVVQHKKNTGQLQCFSSFPFEVKNNSDTRENEGTECLTYDEVLENIGGRKKSSIHFLQLQVTT